MILAVADCADRKGPPPAILELAWAASRWHALPHAGGLVDQPAGLLKRMSAALDIYEALSSWHQRSAGQEKSWIEQHPKSWEIVRNIETLRRRHA